MFGRADGDRDEIDVRRRVEFLRGIVAFAARVALGHLRHAFRQDIKAAGDLEHLFEAINFVGVHAPARAAKTDDADSDFICHDAHSPCCGGVTAGASRIAGAKRDAKTSKDRARPPLL